MASYQIQQPWSVAFANHQLVSPTNNVHPDSSVITNSVNLFVTVTEIVFPTSFVLTTFAKKFVERMATVTRMKSVKGFIALKDAEETVIVPQEKLAKTTNASVSKSKDSYSFYTFYIPSFTAFNCPCLSFYNL